MEMGGSASSLSRDKGDPLFLSVKPGMTVICSEDSGEGWWMGDVMTIDGGARDPKVPTLCQIVDVDTGRVRWVNADLVTHIVPRC